MVDWRSGEITALCVFIFRQMTVFVLGSYLWYFILTLKDVEAGLVTRRLRFNYAHIPYLTARYCNLIELLTIVVSSHLKRPLLGCDGTVATMITSVTGNVALAAASTNLALRAIVMWRKYRFVVWTIGCLCVAHVLLGGIVGLVGIRTQWDKSHQTCLIETDRAQEALLALYGFTLIWDFLILVLTVIGMRKHELPPDSPLSSALFTQGVGYVIVTCIVCIPMAAVVYMDLNNTMNIFLAVPGCTIIVIMSSAVVTSLLKLRDHDSTDDESDEQRPRRRGDAIEKSEGISHGALTTHINLAPMEFRDSSEIQDGRYGVPPADKDYASSIAPSSAVDDVEAKAVAKHS